MDHQLTSMNEPPLQQQLGEMSYAQQFSATVRAIHSAAVTTSHAVRDMHARACRADEDIRGHAHHLTERAVPWVESAAQDMREIRKALVSAAQQSTTTLRQGEATLKQVEDTCRTVGIVIIILFVLFLVPFFIITFFPFIQHYKISYLFRKRIDVLCRCFKFRT